ncbi:segregation and condensation protein A [Tepidibacter sp. Z1-5]|uniref:segregation and condensation protein A n=1 Tax=Tepidibacter sp. Z1-5 TaxID=3134138 RepID=UPI0030BD53B0
MGYNVALNFYEGPMDLLYDLIVKNKIDIYDISIFEITKQYLEYLDEMGSMDLEITSDFIIMACRLLEIKSKYLLYKKNEEEEDPRTELMHQLIEYKNFKKASNYLKDRMYLGEGIFYRKKEEIYIEEKMDLSNLNIDMLMKFLPSVVKEIRKEKTENKLDTIYKKPTISIEEKIYYVKNQLDKKGTLLFKDLIKTSDKEEIIVTFLSVLELIKTKNIVVKQEDYLADIIVKKVE